MAYITREEVTGAVGGVDKLVQYTDDNDTGEVDWTVVDRAIAYATGKFESSARARYSLPVPLTEMVRQTCLDLATFQLIRRRATITEGIYDVARQAHDDAIKFLDKLQIGKAALDVAAEAETTSNPASPDRVLSGPRRKSDFTDEKLRNF